MNTIAYKDLKQWYLNNENAKNNAKTYFIGKNEQPSFHQTGFYSAPSWNWGYQIGIVNIRYTENGNRSTHTFEIVTQFGSVVAAREIVVPTVLA